MNIKNQILAFAHNVSYVMLTWWNKSKREKKNAWELDKFKRALPELYALSYQVGMGDNIIKVLSSHGLTLKSADWFENLLNQCQHERNELCRQWLKKYLDSGAIR